MGICSKICLSCGSRFPYSSQLHNPYCHGCRSTRGELVDENKLTVEEKFLIVNTLRNLSRSFSFNRSTVDAPHVIDKRQAIVDIKVIVKKLDGVI